MTLDRGPDSFQPRGTIATAASALAALTVGVSTVCVIGTFLYEVPYLGLAAFVVSSFTVWFVAAALIGSLLGAYNWRQRRDRLSAALVIVGVLTATGAAVITGRMAAAVERAGADISLGRAFGIGSQRSASPDSEVTYTTFEGQPLQLSIYQPPDSSATSAAPILIYVHGGGWINGSRANHSADMRWFAEQGWLTVSVDYSLSTNERHLWDVTHAQIGCALSWVVQNAQQYSGDSTRLAMTGDSAGGNLAINTAYMANMRTLPSSCGGPIPNVSAVSTLYPVVDAAAGFYRNADAALGERGRRMAASYTGGSPDEFPDRYEAISSFTYIHGHAPPTLMIVGEADHLVAPEGSYRFAKQARDAGVEIELVRVPYAEHVFDAPAGSIGQQAYRQLTVKWLRAHGQTP